MRTSPSLRRMTMRRIHVPRESRDKPTYHSRRVHRTEICQACGWVREYSLPDDSSGIWVYGPWQPPERPEKPAEPFNGGSR